MPRCTALNCRYRAGENGLCGTHAASAARGHGRGKCTVAECVNKASRTAGLCHTHARTRRDHVASCKHPLCDRGTITDYCKQHDMGIDFAAGDWFDHVAAERLYWGHLKGRQPTVPELRWVISRGESAGMEYSELAEQMSMDYTRLLSWRSVLARLETV